MFLEKFHHPYLKLIQGIDIQDKRAREKLVEELVLKKIKKKILTHTFLIFFSFGYHYFKLRIDTCKALEEAFSARKLNALLNLKEEDPSKSISYHQIYSYKELGNLKNQPISYYQILKASYFQTAPMKYKKIWQHLFNDLKKSLKPNDSAKLSFYYKQLRTNYSISHTQIMSYLKRKTSGRPPTSLSLEELQLTFKELMEAQEA